MEKQCASMLQYFSDGKKAMLLIWVMLPCPLKAFCCFFVCFFFVFNIWSRSGLMTNSSFWMLAHLARLDLIWDGFSWKLYFGFPACSCFTFAVTSYDFLYVMLFTVFLQAVWLTWIYNSIWSWVDRLWRCTWSVKQLCANTSREKKQSHLVNVLKSLAFQQNDEPKVG